MKTRLFLFICLSALALHGFTAALAGGVDLPLSLKNPPGTRVVTVRQAIESNIPCVGKEELDRYKEFQPPSIYGNGFPYPEDSNKPCAGNADLDRIEEFQLPSVYGDGFPYPNESTKPYAEKADPDRDVSTIQNQTQASLYRLPLDNCLGMQPRELSICQNAVQSPTIAPARFDQAQGEIKPATTLVEAVHQSTVRFKNVDNAQAAGYGLFHGCVSGPQEGAMGVHFVNGDLVGDGVLDPMRPEALLYEFKNGKMQLSGVEYVVIAEAWHAINEAPPVLMGQLLNYVGSPNRYGIPAFYELHVWAWNNNPLGTFVDWNPKVSCDSYSAEDAPHGVSH
jgi:hypothetical protein